MADKKLNAFTASAAWTSTCSVVGSDSASPTGSFSWTKAKFDAVYGQLSATNVWTAVNTFGPGSTTVVITGASGLIQSSSSTLSGIQFQGGSNSAQFFEVVGPSLFSWNGSIQMSYNRGSDNSFRNVSGTSFQWAASASDSTTPDTGLSRTSAAVVQVNNGTLGSGGAIHLPETPSDADAAAPAFGVVLYSKIVAGKNKLCARFPTGAVQILSSEP